MIKNIKKVITKGVAKVPLIMQLEALECGAACLCMVLAYYEKWIPIEKVREDCGVSRDGSKASNILKAARNYGLAAKGYRYSVKSLKEKGTFPCIVFWNYSHFVVVNGFKGDKVDINDPAKGNYVVSKEVFESSYSGICVFFEPTKDFVPSGEPKSIFSFVVKRINGHKEAIIFLILMSFIITVLGIIKPAFSRIFLDYLLTRKGPSLVVPFFVFLFCFEIVEIVINALQAIQSLRIKGRIAAITNTTYMWKVLNLPMKFFSQRMAGDIQGRQMSNTYVVDALIGTFAPLLLNICMTFFYLFVMIRYSIILTIIGIGSMVIDAFVSKYISNKRINISRVSLRDKTKLNAATTAGIEMIETIKASGAENGFFKRWAGYQANVNTQEVKFLKLNKYLGGIPTFISSVADNLVLFIGVWFAMNGEFTVGMIMAFQGFLSLFVTPASMLVSTSQTVQEMRVEMERIDDVMEYPEDNVFAEDNEDSDMKKLSGNVELKNVSFGYALQSDPFIRDFNMSITPGKSVAIVGMSGSGKSTISKLISGLYKVWGGEILFDGKPMNEIQKSVFRASVAIVDQDIVIFEDTISNNIKMWDDSIEDFDIINAAKDAQIHEDIMARPSAYQTKVIENGRDLSGGQRQRIEIARAIVQNPSIIIFDEATSSLDAKTEYEVVKAIRKRGITSIVIAHRLSTIRSCDEIIVMEKGMIKDRGTHDELMQKCKIYQDLISLE